VYSRELDLAAIPAALRPALRDKLARMDSEPASVDGLSPVERLELPRVWTASDFVADAWLRDPGLASWLAGPGRLRVAADRDWLASELAGALPREVDDDAFMAGLRRFRRRHLARIAWRDLAGIADIEIVLQELSMLADTCIVAAGGRAERELMARHGAPRRADGTPLPLLVLGMGKLGGAELNFSSDVDLVFLFPEHGETDGRRPLTFEEYYNRLGRRIAQILGTVNHEGFVYRVDLRLRPFGDSGPLVVSFGAFEDYLQQHGRDWERYAYVKARPIAGGERFGELYRDVLRPFVYRRYLDFGVFESLRGMKDLIAREVERRELRDNIKLGPGGIREIEFIVQAFQIIRGGSDARLQTRGLLGALSLLAGQKLLPATAVMELAAAYRFLRKVENRLQEWNDEQTHELPADEAGRARLAFAMGSTGWEEFAASLHAHRDRVSAHFQRLVFGPAQAAAGDAASRELERILEPDIDDGQRARLLRDARVVAVDPVLASLAQLRESSYLRRLDATGRRRLTTLLPQLLRQIAGRKSEAAALNRVLHVLERIGGRTVYLALLNENALALGRLVDLCAQSGFLADQIAAFPLLLDELLDERLIEAIPSRAEFAAELKSRMAGAGAEDPEHQVELLRQFQRAAVFRVAVADLSGRLPIMKVSDRLTDIAELIVQQALDLAWEQIAPRLGHPERISAAGDRIPAGLIVVAYGKFGGYELGYGSDLDLVFLHDSAGDVERTTGPAVVENSVFFLRLVQRLVHLLTVHSAAGRLYEVDTRLRPSGKGGLLAQSITGFEQYQRSDAWTWEHQALLRARAVAGPPALRERFEALRVDLLRYAVRRDTLREDVRSMRERMRAELSRTAEGAFDLKQDRGGIADIEFLAQYWALKWSERHAELVVFPDVIRQLESLASIDLVPQATVDVLTGAYRAYRQRIHHLSLEGGGSVVRGPEFAAERDAVAAIWRTTVDA
jgi:[glutamine synthetase] adenylyltransferase / [glutamine synthetase]-adenylyl-L-tyrosine phosphorylase